mgnify:FL=1|jgi:hypothetical protein|tara:strand:- start:3566 stop:4240 length:675 start_codon:yes stop_codon:yes gene_type:complete
MAITLSTTGYCEAADVAAMVQQFTIDTNSDPSTAETEAWISQDFGEINAILRAAGYAAPVAQSGGSLGGTVLLKSTADLMTSVLSLKASSGSLTGSVRRGDFFTIAGDGQRYMATDDNIVNSDGEIVVAVVPWVEVKAEANTAVTFTAVVDAPKMFQSLNATMTAIRVQRAAYSSSGTSVDELVQPLIDERDRVIRGLQNGAYDIPSAVVEKIAGGGTMSLLRS